MSDEKTKTSRSFWIVFAIAIALAAIGTIGNLTDYRKMDRLNSEGQRVFCLVDSVHPKGDKTEVFVTLQVGEQHFMVTKKLKGSYQVGDSVPVYYMEEDPSTNAIAGE